MIVSSTTFDLLGRLLKRLPERRKRSLLLLLPLAGLTGLADLLVVGLISRLFTIVVGQPNRPSLPFNHFFPSDPIAKVLLLVVLYISMNWFASFLRLFLRSRQEKLKSSM